MRKSLTIRRVIGVVGTATLLFAGGLAYADITPPPPFTGCDFLTGGGFIFPTGSKGTFAVGGGCRHGSGIAGIPYWGHLEYHDHGLDLNVHWNDITAYFPEGTTGTDPQTGRYSVGLWHGEDRQVRRRRLRCESHGRGRTRHRGRVRHPADPERCDRLLDLPRRSPHVGRGHRRGWQHSTPQAQRFDHGGLRRVVPCRSITSRGTGSDDGRSTAALRRWRPAVARRVRHEPLRAAVRPSSVPPG